MGTLSCPILGKSECISCYCEHFKGVYLFEEEIILDVKPFKGKTIFNIWLSPQYPSHIFLII